MNSSAIDFRAELNEGQFAAVTGPEGHTLVIAGAGSGKTRTLTYRVAWLLSQGVPPWRILLLTFTNKAAREMLGRVESLVEFERDRLWGGTFHSIGNRILRKNAELLGFTKSFSILDREDSEALLNALLNEGGYRAADKSFPKGAVLADLFGFATNTCRTLDSVISSKYPYFHRYFEELERLQNLYESRKREMNAMDFDDLLAKCVALFELHPKVLETYQSQFQHILVDEFQDTNPLQARFVDMLAGGGASIMAVGDDAQAIYSWRGADCANILDFPKRYPGARMIKIETNYRSVPQVLDLANAAISFNVTQFPKNLKAARKPGSIEPVEVVLSTNHDQARFVAMRIKALLESGIEPSEIAVLYRAHFHSMELQMELTRERIPFRVVSGLRFFEQAHIKDVAAFLKTALNPADRVAFTRMACLLPGIGPRASDSLWRQTLEALGESGMPGDFRVLHTATRPPTKSASLWKQIIHTLEELVPEGKPLPPFEMIRSVREAFYDDYVRAKYPNAETRLEDLDRLEIFAREYLDPSEFLAQLALLSEEDNLAEAATFSESLRAGSGGERVTLSSVHQAKGLEWKAVFLIWLSDGMFPGRRSMENPAALEEERRLFYVALTRCKDLLTLTWPRIFLNASSSDLFQRRSRFLVDLPSGLLKRLDLSGANAPFHVLNSDDLETNPF